MRCLFGASFFAFSTLVLAGCGGPSDAPKLSAVQGTVTFKGQPVAMATVSFLPSERGPLGLGVTDADGKFTIRTNGQPGAVIGEHTVTIVSVEATANSGETPVGEKPPETPAAPKPPKSLIPEKYGSLEKSDLKATVSASAAENNFTFDLKE